jgi:hypothetical protein
MKLIIFDLRYTIYAMAGDGGGTHKSQIEHRKFSRELIVPVLGIPGQRGRAVSVTLRRTKERSTVANPPSPRGVLPKWNGARVCDPQQPGVPNGRRKFHGFSDG